MQLDYTRLNGEYLNWALKYGEERNEDDLRFGQYLLSKYDMSNFKVDVFYIEDYEKTYSELLKDLYERTEK
jgi:hypothetical protein